MKNVLLVEDEEELVDIVGSVLGEEGYNVKKSVTAEAALQLCESYQPDLIICDVKMGEMDGFAMLEKLKMSERLKNIPFIFLTAFDETEARKKGVKLGADAYITKPFDIDDLLRTVRKLVPPA
ncbi:MAG: putative two-component response regulator receiver protein [Bacteroidetes bacterium]|nr:putative two-component response regulator receiver protein [Bacteroidota bacterium]